MNRDLQKELELMEAYHLLANKQAKTSGYAVPEDYFEQKKQKLAQIANQTAAHKVPTGYFDTIADKVMDKIDALEEQPSMLAEIKEVKAPNRKNTRSFIIPFLSVAASVVLLLGVFFWMPKSSDINQTQFAEIVSETFDEEELAFLYDDGETYVLDALYDEFDADTEGNDQLLDPLFQENVDAFDSLFYESELDII